MSTKSLAGALLAAATAAVLAAAPAAAVDGPPTGATPGSKAGAQGSVYRDTHVSAATATKMLAAVLAAAEGTDRVSAAIVDRNGTIIAKVRGDGAGPLSVDSAIAKAKTAAHFCRPTSEMAGVVEGNPRLADIPGSLFLAGGVPVPGTPVCLAGIGVGGAPSGDTDEQYARAGLAEMGGGGK
ncbi:heme-binding protein [Streptomyces sp. A7024]|uniref:Heme-binding protein n=1 Tax=Streptomyces coryli TaxID=1128680 RepID=A0A6G4TZB9_9ACTN|nr:heme-binding protein [Streptomyces coryli]NGN65173.1 heme-binding protein [Streptomyces coryli]